MPSNEPYFSTMAAEPEITISKETNNVVQPRLQPQTVQLKFTNESIAPTSEQFEFIRDNTFAGIELIAKDKNLITLNSPDFVIDNGVVTFYGRIPHHKDIKIAMSMNVEDIEKNYKVELLALSMDFEDKIIELLSDCHLV